MRAQCSAMKDRIAKETNARQGQLDEVKEDFLAEKIKWTAEMGKTRENLQAQKVKLPPSVVHHSVMYSNRCDCHEKTFLDP